MNLVLFEPAELSGGAVRLPLADSRAQHILRVLRRAPGETFVAGVVDGPLGIATLLTTDDTSVKITFAAETSPPALPAITLLIGLPRPQTARDLLRDATTLGVSRIHFVSTERSDPNYATSTLWTSGEWRRHLLTGAAQACDTRLPEVTWTHSLAGAFAQLPHAPASRLALDNYEATTALPSAPREPGAALTLAFGPERGWGAGDRVALRAAGFTLCSLGTRVLRLETAVVAALAVASHTRTAG
jgi:16S rRNA (uracil1498-N3)-methyltransferase